MCTMVLKEAKSYYINNDNSVFCTLIDATKLFDTVESVKLLKLLMVRDNPPVSIKYVYLSWYTNRVERYLFRLFHCVIWS